LANFGLGQERDLFIENLAMLLASGMNIMAALEAVKEEMRSKRMRQIIDELKIDIDAGSPISKALTKTRLLPAHIISLIRIGEETGRLPASLKMVATQQQKDRLFKSKIRSAMIYPVIVLSLAFIIGIGVVWFLLPRLVTIFTGLDIKLPLVTRVLMAIGTFMKVHGLIVLPIFIALTILLILILFVFPKTKSAGQALLFRFPGVKRLIQEIELARFGYILGNLLDSGLSVTDALDSLCQAAAIHSYQKLYRFLRDQVKEGDSFKKCFSHFPNVKRLVPPSIQQMVIAAEQSGRLPETLIKIGKNFEEKSESTTKDLAVILEPIMLIIVWFAVLIIALAVIMPIYGLIGGLEQATNPSTIPAPNSSKSQTSSPAAPEGTTPASSSEQKSSLSKQLKISSNDLGYAEVFDQPSLEGEVLGQASSGAVFDILDREKGWYKITLPNGEVGWVAEVQAELIK